MNLLLGDTTEGLRMVLHELDVCSPKPMWQSAPAKECEMVDHGDYQPHHEFKRLACTACGGMHWEQPMETMTRMRFCPWCGAVVTGWRWLDE